MDNLWQKAALRWVDRFVALSKAHQELTRERDALRDALYDVLVKWEEDADPLECIALVARARNLIATVGGSH